MQLIGMTLRRPHGRKEESREPTEHRDDHACTRNPAGVPRRQRTQRSEIDTPITTRGTNISTLLDLLDPQEEGSDGARKTTKPGTEWVAKPRNAVRHETVRVNIAYLRVVNELEHTHSPRPLGIDDKLLTRITCVERNGVSS